MATLNLSESFHQNRAFIAPGTKLRIKLRPTVAGWFCQIRGGDKRLVSGLLAREFAEVTGQTRFGRGLPAAEVVRYVRSVSQPLGIKVIACGRLKTEPTLILSPKKNAKVIRFLLPGYINDLADLAECFGVGADIDLVESVMRTNTGDISLQLEIQDLLLTIKTSGETYELDMPFHKKILMGILDDIEQKDVVA